MAKPITIKNFFEKDNMLEIVGGTEYLVKLLGFLAQQNRPYHAKIIHEMYLRRELVSISKHFHMIPECKH